jgi:hypothetical protein
MTPTPDAADAADAGQRPERLARAVHAAETALIEYEIAVETFRIEVENFARLHEQRLGPLHARLEELDARLAEAVAARTGDPADQRKAREARSLVTPMPPVDELFGDAPTPTPEPEPEPESPESPQKVRPGPEARKLYRDLVRSAHPDLATEEPERARRDAFIARVNQAYALGDADALRALTAEWEAGPPPPERAALAELAELEHLAARLEWLAARKERLAAQVAALEESAIGSMLRLAPDDPDGLLAAIGTDLATKIDAREAELAALLAR